MRKKADATFFATLVVVCIQALVGCSDEGAAGGDAALEPASLLGRALLGPAKAPNAAFSAGFTDAAHRGPSPLDLRGAERFAVLAGAAVRNEGPTTVFGEVGVSPGREVSGFLPGSPVHLGDLAAEHARPVSAAR